MKLNYLHLCASLILVLGCATTQPEIDEPQVNLTGYPPAFRDGYLDGCNSARNSGNTIQDQNRYKNDSMYAAGWRDGMDICSKKQYD